MVDLTGKRILFFSARAFGIPENIVSTMKMAGAIVDYYDERPANTFFVKAIIRTNRNIIANYINYYHNKIIENTRYNHYDYIFFIKGESFSCHNLSKLFNYHSNAKTIIYYWDSVANNPNALNLIRKFDYSFSFDYKDCVKEGLNFLPLFYFDEYKQVARYKGKREYDLMFVGTTHSDRYKLIMKIADQICRYGGKCFTYFFFQGKIMYYRYKFLNKEMKNVSIKDFNFTPISKNNLLDLYKKSSIIVDIQHPKQTGLTLRCFEALGSKRKIITTNKEIIKYDFFNKKNILVVDRECPEIDKSFLQEPYQDIEEVIYNKYSITSWVEHIFQIVNDITPTNLYTLQS